MKKRSLLPCILALLVACPGQSQEIFGKYLDTKPLVDLKISYTDNATPRIKGQNVNWQAAFSINHLLVPVKAADEPVIGVNLNPSVNYARFMTDRLQVRYTIMQEGWFNFTPSLYLKIAPENNSKVNLFVSVAGGFRIFGGLSDLDSVAGFEAEDAKKGVFEQALVDLTGGVDFDRKFSLSVKYSSAWHDITSATKTYYQKYISPNGRTFVRYLRVRGNFKIRNVFKNPLSGFAEWTGHRYPFNESMLRVGLSYTFRASSARNRWDVSHLLTRLQLLRNMINEDDRGYAAYDSAKPLLLTKIEGLEKSLKSVRSKEEYYLVLKEIDALTQEVGELEKDAKKLDKKIDDLD